MKPFQIAEERNQYPEEEQIIEKEAIEAPKQAKKKELKQKKRSVATNKFKADIKVSPKKALLNIKFPPQSEVKVHLQRKKAIFKTKKRTSIDRIQKEFLMNPNITIDLNFTSDIYDTYSSSSENYVPLNQYRLEVENSDLKRENDNLKADKEKYNNKAQELQSEVFNLQQTILSQKDNITLKLLEQADVLTRTVFEQNNQLRQEQLLEKTKLIEKMQNDKAQQKQRVSQLEAAVNENKEFFDCTQELFQLILKHKYTKQSLLNHCKTQMRFQKHLKKLQLLFGDSSNYDNNNVMTQKSISTTPNITPIKLQYQQIEEEDEEERQIIQKQQFDLTTEMLKPKVALTNSDSLTPQV